MRRTTWSGPTPRPARGAAFQSLWGPVDLEVGAPQHEQDVPQDGVSECPGRGLAFLGCVVGARGRWRRLQMARPRPRPGVFVDERHHHRGGRSSSSWAKYADAFLKISLARLSSLTFCSSCLTRRASWHGHCLPGPASLMRDGGVPQVSQVMLTESSAPSTVVCATISPSIGAQKRLRRSGRWGARLSLALFDHLSS
jgi:hypothetical protein